MNKLMKKWTEFTGIALYFVITLFIAAVLDGFVFLMLWNWFVVPFGLVEISFWHASGLSLLVSFLTYHYYDFKKSDEAGMVDGLTYVFIRPAVVLFIGWILSLFM